MNGFVESPNGRPSRRVHQSARAIGMSAMETVRNATVDAARRRVDRQRVPLRELVGREKVVERPHPATPQTFIAARA